MTAYVYSVATNHSYFCVYAPKIDTKSIEPRMIAKKVLVKGKVNVSQLPGTKEKIIDPDVMLNFLSTPKIAVTELTDEDMEFLKQNKNFMKGVENKIYAFVEKKVDHEKMRAKLAKGDKSRPLTPEGFEKKSDGSASDERIFKNPDSDLKEME